MSAIEFKDDDDEYYRWLGDNPQGFVVNTPRHKPSNNMVLHRASCKHIREPSRETHPGGFTERAYIKVCASNIEALRDWAAQHGRADRSFSIECSFCEPTGNHQA